MSDLVGDPGDRFSRITAHMPSILCLAVVYQWGWMMLTEVFLMWWPTLAQLMSTSIVMLLII